MSTVIIDRGDREKAHAEIGDEQDTGDKDWARKTLDQDCPLSKNWDNVVISETHCLPLRRTKDDKITRNWGHRVTGPRVQEPVIRAYMARRPARSPSECLLEDRGISALSGWRTLSSGGCSAASPLEIQTGSGGEANRAWDQVGSLVPG